MFWNSVWKGFLVLLEWQIWIFIAIYALVSYLHHNKFVKTVGGYESTIAQTVRAIRSYPTIKIALDTIIVTLTAFFIFPILIGDHSLMPPAVVWSMIGKIILITGVVVGLRMLFNAIIGGSPEEDYRRGSNVLTFFVCIGIISFMFKGILGAMPAEFGDVQVKYPSFWTGTAFALLTFPLIFIFSIALGLLMIPFSKETRTVVSETISITAVFIMGIIYMRMYGAYVMQNVDFEYIRQSSNAI